MRCTNCDAHIPHGVTSCPNCGVYALDEPPSPPAPPRRVLWPLLLVVVVVAGAAGGWWWWSRQRKPAPTAKPKPLPVHVVHDRPGGNVQEAEAVRMLRRTLAERGIANDCIAIISHGKKGDAFEMSAVNSCDHTRLGRWRVGGGQAPTPVLP
jgi:hypothetical protein